jgi:hypothetical protein
VLVKESINLKMLPHLRIDYNSATLTSNHAILEIFNRNEEKARLYVDILLLQMIFEMTEIHSVLLWNLMFEICGFTVVKV